MSTKPTLNERKSRFLKKLYRKSLLPYVGLLASFRRDVSLRESGLPLWKYRSKRAFDIALAVALLVSFAPLMLVIAALVKLDSRGPVIYSQVRVGLNRRIRRADRRDGPRCRCESAEPAEPPAAACGRRREDAAGRQFRVLKFRSMRIDAEADGRAVWCRGDVDPRVTRLGRILRKTHLDELPQLINVLKGEMSLVGPRPERPEFVARLKEVVPGYEQRLRLKPGLTGLAQIRHRADLVIDDVKKKIRYDMLYARNASPMTDLKIVLGTAAYVLSPLLRRESPEADAGGGASSQNDVLAGVAEVVNVAGPEEGKTMALSPSVQALLRPGGQGAATGEAVSAVAEA